jgi:hypothetical protein
MSIELSILSGEITELELSNEDKIRYALRMCKIINDLAVRLNTVKNTTAYMYINDKQYLYDVICQENLIEKCKNYCNNYIKFINDNYGIIAIYCFKLLISSSSVPGVKYNLLNEFDRFVKIHGKTISEMVANKENGTMLPDELLYLRDITID